MHIAQNADVKFENINADGEKMMTLTIFQCIHQNLRLVYVGQQDLLANGYKLWKTLELRFQKVYQVARDIQRFFRLEQGNRSLYNKFMVDFDNLRRKLAGSKPKEVMPEDAMIHHLFRAISPTSQASFPHGLTNRRQFPTALPNLSGVH